MFKTNGLSEQWHDGPRSLRCCMKNYETCEMARPKRAKIAVQSAEAITESKYRVIFSSHYVSSFYDILIYLSIFK